MGKRLLLFFLTMGFCVFWGCAESKSSADFNARPVAEKAQPHTPAPAKATEEKHRQAVPAPVAVPPVVSKAKPQVATAPQAPAKNEVTESRPSEIKVAKALDQNPQLSSKVKPLLPPRTSVRDAAAGFKNERQFIAAMHLAKNLGIPFKDIKTRMTGEHRMSLNDSLRDLRPNMTKKFAKAEVKKAEEQAKDDEKHAKDEAKKAAAQEKLAANRKS